MKKYYCLAISFFLIVQSLQSQITTGSLLLENRTNPIGIGERYPQFSWQLSGSKRNLVQTAYEIAVTSDANGKRVVWNSGKVQSDSSVHVSYRGPSLQSGQHYYWKVRAWDNYNNQSSWSALGYWQMGLLDSTDWQAKWIGPGFTEEASRPSPLFRKEFKTNKKIISATAFITAHGLYEASINGQRIGDAYLTPGWTAYRKRLQYQTFDVTNLLKNGGNAIGVSLGNGWYRGIIGFSNSVNVYGKDISLLLQLDILYTDGTHQLVLSDESWKSSTGSIRYCEIYNGETIDDRLDKSGWALPGYDDSGWSRVSVAEHSKGILIATENEPIRKHEIFQAIRVFQTPKGEQVIDFGQNLVGWVKLKVTGKAGDTITIAHAEVLDKDGNFYTENLREAKATDQYILKGGGEEVFEPHFTWHGFRYIRIQNYPGNIRPENFTAITLYSDMKPTGSFTCSDPRINQLQHNIQWGQKGNFLDVPTDCPQRDERLGWTGDAQVFSRTATFNMNVNDFFSKWLKDVAADQFPDGGVPFVVPNVLGPGAGGSTGWADVATIIPWNVWLAYGDKKVLENQYSSMKAWVEYMHTRAVNDLWNKGFHFGDWLFYRPEDDNDGRAAVTDKYLIAQCFYAHSTQLVINTARILNQPGDVTKYSDWLTKIKSAFVREYLTPNGRLVSGTQTAYVLALNFDMLPEELRQQAAARLAENVQSYDDHLTTGFLGTPYLCHVLTRFGYNDIAYKLLLQDSYPSWLYPVSMGATTIWERWDGIRPDSTLERPSMNSYNHYSYGAIGDWMYRVMVGVDTYEDGVGYKHIRIMPHPGGGFTNASVKYQTYYGELSSGWEIRDGKLSIAAKIPVNTRATIFIPATSVNNVTENGVSITPGSGIKTVVSQTTGYVELEIGSGDYHFEVH